MSIKEQDSAHESVSCIFDESEPNYSSLICPICLEVLNNPVVHSCGNTFCADCVKSVSSCPMCRESCTFHDFNPPSKIITQMILSLRVTCESCKEKMTYERFLCHQNDCCVSSPIKRHEHDSLSGRKSKHCRRNCKHIYEKNGMTGKCIRCGICNHEYDSSGRCKHCGVVCQHKYENGRTGICVHCGICNHEYDSSGRCKHCGMCTHKYENGEDGRCLICGQCKHHFITKGISPISWRDRDTTWGECIYCGKTDGREDPYLFFLIHSNRK